MICRKKGEISLYKVPIGRAIFVLSFKGDLTRHDLLNVKESFKNT